MFCKTILFPLVVIIHCFCVRSDPNTAEVTVNDYYVAKQFTCGANPCKIVSGTASSTSGGEVFIALSFLDPSSTISAPYWNESCTITKQPQATCKKEGGGSFDNIALKGRYRVEAYSYDNSKTDNMTIKVTLDGATPVFSEDREVFDSVEETFNDDYVDKEFTCGANPCKIVSGTASATSGKDVSLALYYLDRSTDRWKAYCDIAEQSLVTCKKEGGGYFDDRAKNGRYRVEAYCYENSESDNITIKVTLAGATPVFS